MSEQATRNPAAGGIEVVGPQAPSKPPMSSLKERMRRRAEEIAERTSDCFPVPLFDSILAVEMRVVPWAKTEQFIERNSSVPSRVTLNTALDEIVEATAGFREITEEGEVGEPVSDAHDWHDIATKFAGKTLPDGAGPRVAVLSVCGDQGAMALSALYRRWLGGADTGLRAVRREVEADF